MTASHTWEHLLELVLCLPGHFPPSVPCTHLSPPLSFFFFPDFMGCLYGRESHL